MSRIWLLDGRSGSGKTVLADALAAELGGAVVHMDDLYPGWGGLEEGSAYALERIVRPLARGEDAVWRRWDWAADARAEARLGKNHGPGAPRMFSNGAQEYFELYGGDITHLAKIGEWEGSGVMMGRALIESWAARSVEES